MKTKQYRNRILTESGNVYDLSGKLLPMYMGIGVITSGGLILKHALIDCFGEWGMKYKYNPRVIAAIKSNKDTVSSGKITTTKTGIFYLDGQRCPIFKIEGNYLVGVGTTLIHAIPKLIEIYGEATLYMNTVIEKLDKLAAKEDSSTRVNAIAIYQRRYR